MQRVDVYNRMMVGVLKPTPNTVVISISAPGDPAPLRAGWDDVLRLEFHDIAELDIIDGSMKADNLTPFTKEIADTAWEFIERNKTKSFMVHCDAGISRSVAMGQVVAQFLSIPLSLHAVSTDEFANSLVRRLMMRKFWEGQAND